MLVDAACMPVRQNSCVWHSVGQNSAHLALINSAHCCSWWRGTVVECRSGRRTFPVLRSTCSWWVTTNVGRPSAIGQPTRPTQPFILSGSIKWVVSWNQMCCRLQVAPSGESYEGNRRPGRKQRQPTARSMAWFTSRHLRADCLYTGSSFGPNAR